MKHAARVTSLIRTRTRVGKNFTVLKYTNTTCDVLPYSNQYAAVRDIPIITGGTAYQCERTGEVFILVINEAIWLGSELNHSLWNAKKMRHFGVGLSRGQPVQRAPTFDQASEA